MVRELRLMLTDDCPYACSFCHNEWQPNGRHRLDINLAIAAVDVAVAMGVRHVYLSGGEPLLHRGVLDLIGMIRIRHPQVEIGMATNASETRRGWLESCREAGVRLRVNIPTLNPERYRSHTGGGSLRNPTANIDRASSLGLYVGINTVWLGQSPSEVAELLALAARLGTDLKFLLWNRGPTHEVGADDGPLHDLLSPLAEHSEIHGSVFRYLLSSPAGGVRARVVGVPCNTRNQEACREFGELRLLANGEFQGCIHGATFRPTGLDERELRAVMEAAVCTRGACPHTRTS
jgi:cyclic pyranopterin phosphate synthase